MRAISQVLVDARSADVDEHDGAAVAQLGELFLHEPVNADTLEADGIEHAGRRFDNTWRRMPLALAQEQTLDRDAAERRQIDDVRVLDAIAEATARGYERVRECQPSNRNGKIHGQCASASHRMRVASNTGPSTHDRTKCGGPAGVLVKTTQL